METKRCQRCHKLLRVDAHVCSRCGGHDFVQATPTRSRQTIRLTAQDDVSFPSNPPASPHRAGHYSGLHPEDQPYQSSFLPVQRPLVSTPFAIVEEPEDSSLATLEDVGDFIQPGNGVHAPFAQPVGEATFATLPEPQAEPFDSPAEKRRVATFTPLPQPRQQRGPQVYPISSAQPSTLVSPQDSTEVYQAGPVTPPTREPIPITLQHARRRRGFRGGIIPVLLVLSCFLFLIATSILAFLLFSNKPASTPEPTLYAEPSGSLRAGDTLIISGSRFPGNDLLHFTRDNDVPILDQNGKQLEVTTYSTGNFAVQINIPQNWQVGSHMIYASDQQGTLTQPVTISIAPTSSTSPHLQLATTQMTMGADNIGAVTHQDLALTNTGGATVHWKASSDSAWLSVNPKNGTFSGSEEVVITVNRGTLAAKSYTGHLTFLQQDNQQSLELTVTMSVNPAPPTVTAAANLVLSSAALTFNGTAAQNPTGQVLTLLNTGGQPLNWSATATTSGGGNWLAMSSTSGSLLAGGQASITISAISTGLGAGNYGGTLTFTYGGSSTSVTAALVVTVPLMPVLTLQPGSLIFNAIQGQNPPPQSFVISNTGNAPLDWGISEDTNGRAYAQVSATSGTLAAGKSISITVRPSIAQLSAATIGALIKVWDTDQGTTVKSQQITVTFMIVNQAVISLNNNQMSFAHDSTIQSSSQLLIVTDSGSTTLNWALTISNSSPVQWLTTSDSTTGSLTPGTTNFVNLTCDSTHLSPGTYTATVNVYDTDAKTPVQSQTVIVTLVVS